MAGAASQIGVPAFPASIDWGNGSGGYSVGQLTGRTMFENLFGFSLPDFSSNGVGNVGQSQANSADVLQSLVGGGTPSGTPAAATKPSAWVYIGGAVIVVALLLIGVWGLVKD